MPANMENSAVITRLEKVFTPIPKKRSESNREKEKYTHLNAEFQRIARRVEKAFLSDQCKEIE